jgi:hypothetical protein
MDKRPKAFLDWAADMFGPIARNRTERASRFVEEALELAQAAGLSEDTVARIALRVYSRPAGLLPKEIGQAQATLETFAENEGMNADELAEHEWARVRCVPREEWERRHSAKIKLGIAGIPDPSP